MYRILNWLYFKFFRLYFRLYIDRASSTAVRVQYSLVPPPGERYMWMDVPPPTDGYVRYQIKGKRWKPWTSWSKPVRFFFEGDPRLLEVPERYTRERLDSDVKAFADTLPTQKDRGATDG